MSSIEDKIGYRFKNGAILQEALTHKSYASEHRASRDNERLEFLGDSVLGLIVAHHVYAADPDSPEGRLAKLKAVLVSRHYLSTWAHELNLGEHMLLGQGELNTGGRQRDSILSNAMESVIGAVFLDGGFPAAEKFINAWLKRQPLHMEEADYKSALQEKLQKKLKDTPVYQVLSTVGPEHEKVFTVTVEIQGNLLGRGKGKNKKEAEQSAAKDALDKMENPR